MPRPQYTDNQITELTHAYQAAAYPYVSRLLEQLEDLEHDETRPAGSQGYLARKAHLNSQIYLITQYAMDARQNIALGYPTKFHADSFRNLSNRMMEDPVYRNTMANLTFEQPDLGLQERFALHNFREQVDAALPENYRNQPLAEDVLPDADRSTRAVTYRQVLQELEATGTGYYVPGWTRGSNSQEFENVKTELRRQIAMLEGGMPLSSADDDRMIQLLDTYSNGKHSSRTRGFGNTRAKSMMKVYAEIATHPAPRAADAQPLPTAQEISGRYNNARHLDPQQDANHEDFVDITRDTYRVTPERTLQQEYDAAVQTMRQISDTRLANGGLTAQQRQAYSDALMRAVALQSFMIRDPAGANAAVNERDVEILLRTVRTNEAVLGAMTSAINSPVHMNEVTYAMEHGYHPNMTVQYRQSPADYYNSLFNNLRTASVPNINERLAAAQQEISNLHIMDNRPLTEQQAETLRLQAARVIAMRRLRDRSEMNGNDHVTPEQLDAEVETVLQEYDIDEAIRVCREDPQRAAVFSGILSMNNSLETYKTAVDVASRGGVNSELRREYSALMDMPEQDYEPEMQHTAEESLVRYVAMLRIQEAHKNTNNPNPVLNEQELQAEIQRIHEDQAFMDAVTGNVTNTAQLKAMVQGLSIPEYNNQVAQMQNLIQRHANEPQSREFLESQLASTAAVTLAIRNLQQRAGSENLFFTQQQIQEEVRRVERTDEYLGMQRALMDHNLEPVNTLMNQVFNKPLAQYAQSYQQHVRPIATRYPYPAPQAGTIGALYNSVHQQILVGENDRGALITKATRPAFIDNVVKHLALRQLVLENPEGQYAQMDAQMTARYEQLQQQIRNDGRYAPYLAIAGESVPNAGRVFPLLERAIDLNALKARQNRDLSGDFVDPMAASFSRMKAADWVEFERQNLLDLTSQPNKVWTAEEKEGLMRRYARMHEMVRKDIQRPERAEELVGLSSANDSGRLFLERPGVREQLEEVFADPAAAMSHTIDAQKEAVIASDLPDADKLARLMALGKLEQDSFGGALVAPSVLQAEEEKIRRENSYKRLAGYLEAGHGLNEIPVLAGNNYYDAMVQNSYMLPGMQQDYPTRLNLIAADSALKLQQNDAEGAALEMVKLYILKQYQKDGWAVEDLPSPGEIDRMARELAKTSDFRDAMETMKAQPQRIQTVIQSANEMDADGIAQILSGYAYQQRGGVPADLREPNFLHELQAQQMYDAYTRLEQGNAGARWTSEAEKTARRDDYIRFTAMNRLMTDNPNRAFIPEEEIQAEMQKLVNDQEFMQMLNDRLQRPNMLRFTVFNSSGVVRWSEVRTLEEHRDQLRNAEAAEREGRPGFATAYGSVSTQLLDILDARLSGRERDNGTLSTRDLNMSKNDLLYSARFRSIENALQADASNFDRVENLLKLPADRLQEEYNKLTDEFMEKYPNVPMRDKNTIGHQYNMALENIKNAASEDPAILAADDQRRQQLVRDIREVMMDRRILIKAPIDTQLMRRSIGVYDSPAFSGVERVREHEQEAVDRLLGDLDQRIQDDPNVLKGYLDVLRNAGDLRELADQEYHAREPFADPVVTQLRDAGLDDPGHNRQAAIDQVANAAAVAIPDETPEQREARLSAQIASIANQMLLKDLPDDELPTQAEQAQQEAYIQSIPGYREAVAHLAKNPQALNDLMDDVKGGQLSGAQFIRQLDSHYNQEMLQRDPQSHPVSNMMFHLRKNTMEPYKHIVSVNSTGAGIYEWQREQREAALDGCVRCTAVNRLLADNPDRVYFSEAEVEAANRKVVARKDYIRSLENDAPNGLALRANFFGYQGIMYWQNVNDALNNVEKAIASNNALTKEAFVTGAWHIISEKLPYKRNGAIDNNEADVTAEKNRMHDEYAQTKEHEVLLRAFSEDPSRLKRYMLEVFTLPTDEFEEAHKNFANEMAALYNINLQAEEAQADGNDIDIEINGEAQNIQQQDAFHQMEAKLAAEAEAQEKVLNGDEDLDDEVDALDGVDLEGEQGEPQAVGWPQFEEAAPIQNKQADGAFYNSQKGVLDGQLRQDMPNPSLVKIAVENLYLIALLKKQGINPTPQAVSNARESLQGDAAFQKFLKKCMGERSFAREQLNSAFASPDADKMRAEMNKLTPDAFERTKEQIAYDLEHGNVGADFEYNFRRLYAQSQLGDQANNEDAIEQKVNELAQNQNLNKVIARLKEDPKTHQQGLQPGYGHMLLNGVFKTSNPQTVANRVNMVATGLANEKHGEAHYMEKYGPKPPVIRVPARDLVPNSPEAEFQKSLAKLNEAANERTLKQNAGFDPAMSQQEKGQFFMQACKTVALYNLSQSPQYKGKELPAEALKAEMLRLKDDPAMKQTALKAIEDPAAHKALADGMVRTFNDPLTFTGFVKGVGQDPQQASDWLNNSYPDPLPKLQTLLYKPASNIYGSPKLPGIRVRGDKFTMPNPGSINENDQKYLQLKDELAQKWNSYKGLHADQRTEQQKTAAIKSMAKVYAMRQLIAAKPEQGDPIDNLEEKLNRRTDMLMKDPAFLNVAKSSVENPRDMGDAMVRMLSGNYSFTNLTNNLQSRSDRIYCEANQIDFQTGKKIVQQQQPQQEVQQGGPVA